MVFVLDTSGSIGNSRFQLFRDFVSSIARVLDVSLQQSLVGVILFSNEARIQFSLTEFTDESSLLSAIDDIPYRGGNTNTADALRLLLSSARDGTMELRGGYPHIAIVLTDGESNNQTDTKAAARELHENGGFDQVYAVGVGGANIDELNAIASNASLVQFTNKFDASTTQELQFDITQQFCNVHSKCLYATCVVCTYVFRIFLDDFPEVIILISPTAIVSTHTKSVIQLCVMCVTKHTPSPYC